MRSGLRVIYPDGTVVVVPLEMETAEPWIRERYCAAQYSQTHGALWGGRAVTGGVEDERDEAHGSGGGAGQGRDDL